MNRISSILSLTALALATAASCMAQQPYKVVAHWKVGGSGHWDYMHVDAAAHLLYLAHGTQVDVVDTATGKSVGAITGMKGTHGIAFGPDGKFGYISDGTSNDVVVFSRKTFATVATIPTGGIKPDGIVYEPVTKTVWAFNGHSDNVSVIDTASRRVVAVIQLPGNPEFPEADGKGNVFDNIESQNSIVRLSALTKKLTATWALQDCDAPSGLAYDRVHHRLFSVCHNNKMAVVDAETGRQLATPDIGESPDAARYSTKYELAFSSNGDGTLSVIDAAHGYKVLESLPTEKGARTMAYDEKTDHIYVVTAKFGANTDGTPANSKRTSTIVPGSFTVLVIARH